MHAGKIADAVWLFVFNIGFPTPPFSEQFYCPWAFRIREAKPFMFRTLLQTGQAAFCLAAGLSWSGSVSSSATSGAVGLLRDLVLLQVFLKP